MPKQPFQHSNRNPYAYTILQNLKDAGCSDETVDAFMTLQEEGDYKEQIKLLSDHRKHLLDKLHRNQRRIDCLDYLIYQMEQKSR